MRRSVICDDRQMIHETLREYIAAESFSCVSAFDGEIMKGLGESIRAENTDDGARFIFTVRRGVEERGKAGRSVNP
jgi:hypothetical protein